MTITRKLDRQVWKPYFDKVSALLEGRTVEIEVASLQLGAHIAAQWLPVFGVLYDPRDDLIAVMTQGLNHLIRKPRDVFVEHEGINLLSMEVIDGDGVSQIVKFREPLLLPGPGS